MPLCSAVVATYSPAALPPVDGESLAGAQSAEAPAAR